jgi:DNA polymerase III alpha subunit (gram-positive type)
MNCDFVVFDLETTGLSSRFDEIIQIAAARLGPGGIVTEEVFATFVRPEATIPSFITGLTGIPTGTSPAHRPSPKPWLHSPTSSAMPC